MDKISDVLEKDPPHNIPGCIKYWKMVTREAMLLYAYKEKHPDAKEVAFQRLPSRHVLQQKAKRLHEFLYYLESFERSHWSKRGWWELKEVNPDTFFDEPTKTFKSQATPVQDGIRWSAIYYYDVEKDEWKATKGVSDDVGIYAEMDDKKHYYHYFRGTEPPATSKEKRAEPKKAPAKKTTGTKKAPSAAKKTPVPASRVGTNKTLPGHVRGRLNQLLADARDPPGLLFEGTTDQLKGIRKRLELSPFPYKYCSSTFHWIKHKKKVEKDRLIVLFNSLEERATLLKKFPIRAKGIKVIHCSFNGF